jgi:hypothetical protein
MAIVGASAATTSASLNFHFLTRREIFAPISKSRRASASAARFRRDVNPNVKASNPLIAAIADSGSALKLFGITLACYGNE